MVAFFAFISSIFVIWRGVFAIPGKRWILKIFLSLLVIIAAFKFQIFHLLGGPMYFAPVLPRWLLLAGAVLFSIHFIFFFLLLFSEAIKLLLRLLAGLLKRKLPSKLQNTGKWLNPCLALLAITFAVIGIYYGTAFPKVKRVTFEIEDLPFRADGMKIVFLTDLHIDQMRDPEWLPLVVAKVNSLEPDLILLGGDLMDGRLENLYSRMLPLRNLKAKNGVYGVPGNHEYYSGYDEWMEFLNKECNIKMLVNSSCNPGGGITLMGIADYAGKKFKRPTPNFRAAFNGVGASDKVILLSHRPDLAREAEKLDVMLQISGHTHGGMLWGLDRIVGRLNGGFVSGKYTRGNTQIYVSNGTGIWGGFPVRLSAPSEITLITLVRD